MIPTSDEDNQQYHWSEQVDRAITCQVWSLPREGWVVCGWGTGVSWPNDAPVWESSMGLPPSPSCLSRYPPSSASLPRLGWRSMGVDGVLLRARDGVVWCSPEGVDGTELCLLEDNLLWGVLLFIFLLWSTHTNTNQFRETISASMT